MANFLFYFILELQNQDGIECLSKKLSSIPRWLINSYNLARSIIPIHLIESLSRFVGKIDLGVRAIAGGIHYSYSKNHRNLAKPNKTLAISKLIRINAPVGEVNSLGIEWKGLHLILVISRCSQWIIS